MNIQTIALLILVPLLMWRVYARLKRMMARQQSVMSRHWTGLAVFTAMVLVPGSELLAQPASLGWLAVGTAAGYACMLLRTPIPWMLGPLFSLALLRVLGADIAAPLSAEPEPPSHAAYRLLHPASFPRKRE